MFFHFLEDRAAEKGSKKTKVAVRHQSVEDNYWENMSLSTESYCFDEVERTVGKKRTKRPILVKVKEATSFFSSYAEKPPRDQQIFIVMYYFKKWHEVGKKKREWKKSLNGTIAVYGHYFCMHSISDYWNSFLHGRTWTHKTSGKDHPDDTVRLNSFAFANVMLACHDKFTARVGWVR
eukprot:scaffold1247_cov170-Ochromonas_danica.AAC.1